MAYSESVINGITKRSQISGVYSYVFPIAYIVADNNANTVTYEYLASRIASPQYTIQFPDISPNYGATTPEGYVDALAIAGAYNNRGTVSQGSGSIDLLSNRIVVTEASQMAGTLDPEKEYFLDGFIDFTGVQLDITNLSSLKIRGYDFNLSGIFKTDSATLFVGTNVGDVLMDSFQIISPNSSVFALDGTGNNSFEVNKINFNSCASLGYLSGFRQGLELQTGRFGGTPTLELRGVWSGYRVTTSIVRSIANSPSQPLFKAGTGADALSMSGRFLTDMNVDLGGNAPFADFAPANFTQNNVFRCNGMTILRNNVLATDDSVTMPNIGAQDNEAKWQNNEGLSNTSVGGKVEVTAQALTLMTLNLWAEIDGTYTTSVLSHMDSPKAGELRSLDPNRTIYLLLGQYVVECPPNRELEMRIVVYRDATSTDEVVDLFKATVDNLAGSRDVAKFNISSRFEMGVNDIVRLQIRNITDNNDITAEKGSYYLLTAVG